MADALNGASALITRAMDLEVRKRLTEALVYYQEGIQMYLDYLKVAAGAEKKRTVEKAQYLMTRAEAIKKRVNEEKKLSTYHEEIIVKQDTTGYSYESVFGRFLDSTIKIIRVEDPYICKYHQLNNFLRFCELIVKKCPNLNYIVLVTQLAREPKDSRQQSKFFHGITDELLERHIKLKILSNPALHDRAISLSNGWIIKIGRGLDYFQPSSKPTSLGCFDMDHRPCLETKIDVYFSKNLTIDY